MSFELIGEETELDEGEMKCKKIISTERQVMLIKHRGKIYCMDQACYHHGGPLVFGDIEDMGGKTVIRCPWHNYKISIENGEGLYIGIDMVPTPAGVQQMNVIKSKGIKQRTHPIELRNGQIYVQDSSLIEPNKKLESDTYAKQELMQIESKNSMKIHSKLT